MNKATILTQIDQDSSLLSLPQSLSEMLQGMEDPDFSADKLAAIILKDPAMTSRILKLANSAFYHHASEVSTVHQAIQMLGMTTVRCLALSTSVFNPAKFEKNTGINIRKFFTTILTVGAASQKIAGMSGKASEEEALIAGLLHEIGTMYFLHHHPDDYRPVIEDGTSKVFDIERRIFGIDHAEVGFLLARKWHLPEPICNSVRYHHTKTNVPDSHPLTDIVRLAYLLTNDVLESDLDVDATSNSLQAVHAAGDRLGLSKDQIDEIVSSLPTWTLSVAEYLGVDIGDIEEMITRANKKLWQVFLLLDSLFREREELTKRLVQHERTSAALETRDIAVATLSHYLNNAVMAIYGRSQLLRMKLEKGESQAIIEELPNNLDVIDRSIKKIVAVLVELKNLKPLDELEFLNSSRAVNIDDRIVERLKKMESESDLVMPGEVEDIIVNELSAVD